jgi:hypothetical protein
MGALVILIWLSGAVLLAYSVYRNLKDAHHAESLRAEIVTIKEEHQIQFDHSKRQFEKALTEQSEAYRSAARERDESNARAYATEQALKARISELENAPPRVDYEALMALTERDRQENVFLKSKLSAAENQIEVLTAQLISSVPSLLVKSEIRGGEELLVFINDSDKHAVGVRVSQFITREPRGTIFVHELMIVPDRVPLVAKGAPVECRLILKDRSGDGFKSLTEMLRMGTPETVDVVTIQYETSTGLGLSREFLLTRQIDGSVFWEPRLVRLREAPASSSSASEAH